MLEFNILGSVMRMKKKQRSDEEIDVTFLVCIKFHVK